MWRWPMRLQLGHLQLTEGKTKAGVVWPEELDAVRFLALSNTLELMLNLSVSPAREDIRS
jgi:hypothetical protein